MILAVEAGEVYYMFNTHAMQTNLLFLSIGAYGSAFGLGNAFYFILYGNWHIIACKKHTRITFTE